MLIDDFAGTGRTLVRGMERELNLLRRATREGIQVVVACLVGFADARSEIEAYLSKNKIDAEVYFCDELGSEHSAFSESSSIFSDDTERRDAMETAESTGFKLERRHPLGYGRIAGLVVFPDSCPNNSLPILWAEKGDWRPLFRRF